jgi:hypothetical protein
MGLFVGIVYIFLALVVYFFIWVIIQIDRHWWLLVLLTLWPVVKLVPQLDDCPKIQLGAKLMTLAGILWIVISFIAQDWGALIWG